MQRATGPASDREPPRCHCRGEAARPSRPRRCRIGALLLAGRTSIDAFPVELNELAAEFFARFRPIAKA